MKANNSTKSPRPSTHSVLVAGNPNSGKTTLFNSLTGLKYKVANYPGVTVEKKTGRFNLTPCEVVELIDLPGVYSLSSSSLDEKIATEELLQVTQVSQSKAVIVVLDASNLERNLYLATQIVDLGIPTIFALNMVDVADKNGIEIRDELLAGQFGVPVVRMVARQQHGTANLNAALKTLLSAQSQLAKSFSWLPADSEFRKSAELVGKLAMPEGSLKQQTLRGVMLLSDSLSTDDRATQEALVSERAQLLVQGIDTSTHEATLRYKWINQVVRKSSVVNDPARKQLSERIDAVITHRFWGSLIFLCVMGFVFQTLFMWASFPMDFIDWGVSELGTAVGFFMPEGILKSLVIDGIIAGVGSVLIFIPQIALLFFFLSLLEDSGYLSRAAFLMDRIMRQFGLQGRSFIPLLSSFACAIPGIMSTRTIPSVSDRLATILVAPLMSCSARLPVYTLLIAAFIPSIHLLGFIQLQGLVLLAMYLLGVAGAMIVAWLLKNSLLRGEPAVFVMEMPPFRMPSLLLAARDAYDRIVIFLKSAGTIILSCSIVLWFLASYPEGPVKNTFAGQIGTFIEPAIEPLGYNWEIGVGLIASFAAREVFVSSLSTVYNLQQEQDSDRSIIKELKARKSSNKFSLASALSLMVFYVFACQCISTLAICRRETGTWYWPAFMFFYMTTLAYVGALFTYRVMGWLL